MYQNSSSIQAIGALKSSQAINYINYSSTDWSECTGITSAINNDPYFKFAGFDDSGFSLNVGADISLLSANRAPDGSFAKTQVGNQLTHAELAKYNQDGATCRLVLIA